MYTTITSASRPGLNLALGRHDKAYHGMAWLGMSVNGLTGGPGAKLMTLGASTRAACQHAGASEGPTGLRPGLVALVSGLSPVRPAPL